MKREKGLGFRLGSMPKIHLAKEDGSCFCGAKKMPTKRSLKENEWDWVCKKCVEYSKAEARKNPF